MYLVNYRESILRNSIFVFILIVSTCFFIACKENRKPLPYSQESISKKFVATVDLTRKKLGLNKKVLSYLYFTILERSTKKKFRVERIFSTGHRLDFVWDREDRLWIDSSDEGTFYLTENTDKTWKFSVQEIGGPQIPKKLK